MTTINAMTIASTGQPTSALDHPGDERDGDRGQQQVDRAGPGTAPAPAARSGPAAPSEARSGPLPRAGAQLPAPSGPCPRRCRADGSRPRLPSSRDREACLADSWPVAHGITPGESPIRAPSRCSRRLPAAEGHRVGLRSRPRVRARPTMRADDAAHRQLSVSEPAWASCRQAQRQKKRLSESAADTQSIGGNRTFGDGFTPPDRSALPRPPERPSSSSA